MSVVRDEKGVVRKGTPNPNGAPAGFRRTKSKIRKTLEQLQELEQEALKNIETSIKRKDIDKEALATAKWLITTMVTLNRAAIADEQFAFNQKVYREEMQQRAEEKREGTTGNVIRFSTKMIDNFNGPEDDED